LRIMDNNVSFLLGSGFSIPEKLPSAALLNERLGRINEKDIFIHTDQKAFFLNGAEDPIDVGHTPDHLDQSVRWPRPYELESAFLRH